MRFFRHFIRGSFCGGPLAAVIGLLMALQALIGGFGTGAMACAGVGAMEICSTEGVEGHAGHVAHGGHSGHGGMQMAGMDMSGHAEGAGKVPGEGAHKNHRPDCCLTACQVAASVVHFGLHSSAPQPVALAIRHEAPTFVALEAVISPRQLGLGGDARGPPPFPI
jgi:hypothetical protein